MNAFDKAQSRTRPPGRGVGESDVALAADALLREGFRPTIERIREKLGRGSPNTINPLLDQWWKGLAARLSGGPEMLERIPAPAFHVLEALWVQLQIAARDRAAVALAAEHGKANRDAQAIEIRSQVLSLREGELNERLRRQEDRLRSVEDQLQVASQNLRRAEVERTATQSRVRTLELELAEAAGRITALLTRAVVRQRANVHRKSAKRKTKLSLGSQRGRRRTVKARRRSR